MHGSQKTITQFVLIAAGILLFLYFNIFIKPALYYVAQEPIFFAKARFFQQFLTWPGGLLEYVSALLSQFFYYPLLGASMLAFIFVLIFFTLRQYIKNTLGVDPSVLTILPITLLLLSHNNYEHAVVIDLVLLVSLFCAMLYSSPERKSVRLLFLLFAGPLFYFVAGAAFLLFVIYAVVFEIMNKRDVLLVIPAMLMAMALPFISGSGLFVIRLKHAFLQPAFPKTAITGLLLAVYLAPLLLVLLLFFLKRSKSTFFFSPKPLLWIGKTALTLIVFFAVPLLMIEKPKRQFWQVTYHAQQEEWRAVLDVCRKEYPKNPQVISLINRALCHTGALGDRMFAYNQDFGLGGLFVMQDAALSSPLIRSNLYFDVGHYNEAKHWAQEAVSVEGETCWNLQRLAEIYLIYNEKAAAAIYLNKLQKTIPLKKWARRYQKYVSKDTDIADDPVLGPLLDNVISEDFLSFVHKPIPDLEKLVEVNPHNKFAFDYLLASLLLTKQLGQFVDVLHNYQWKNPLPRAFQEALIFYVSQVPDKRALLGQFGIQQETLQRFQAFQSAYRANRTNRRALETALSVNFSDTYWTFLLFHQQKSDA